MVAVAAGDLPQEVLAHVMLHMEFPNRLVASQVCRKWRDASKHPRFTKRANAGSRSSINVAIAESVAGGTVLLEPGYYQETVVVSKPIRLVGQLTQALNGDARKAVVVEGHASIAFVCWAPCRIEHLLIRTRVASAGCSAVTVMPACSLVSLHDCELANTPGLKLPSANVNAAAAAAVAAAALPSPPRLVMHRCVVTGSADVNAAVTVAAGRASLTACTVTGNHGAGVAVHPGATAHIQNCDISFNKKPGVVMGGGGAVVECVMWGNGPMQAGDDPVNVHVDAEHVWGDCAFTGNHTLSRSPLTPKEVVCAAFLDQAAHLAPQPLQPQFQPLQWEGEGGQQGGGHAGLPLHVQLAHENALNAALEEVNAAAAAAAAEAAGGGGGGGGAGDGGGGEGAGDGAVDAWPPLEVHVQHPLLNMVLQMFVDDA